MAPQTVPHMRPLAWFEIPATDLERAVRFYEALLAVTMETGTMGPSRMAVFPFDKASTIGGCVMTAPGFKPSAEGVVAYLNAEPSLDAALARVAPAGGQVVVPRTELPPGMGAFAKIRDTEGNVVGLHALA